MSNDNHNNELGNEWDNSWDDADARTTAFDKQSAPADSDNGSGPEGAGTSEGGEGSVDRSDIDRLQKLLGDRYQLQWIIGHGGMSTVWLAKDLGEAGTEEAGAGGNRTGAGRDVAIKILRPEYTENTEFRTRFRNEAEASMGLDSPNVVATYDYGEVEEHEGYRGMVFCYIVMEYVKGEALADVLVRQRTLPEPLVADLLAQAATGLEEIHSSGMVHRDIKPGNLLITADGIVKVTDFGIAKAAEAVPLTRTGMVVGTAQYVSPEQAQGLEVGPSSDIYSLGVVGYECLAGRRPFTGDSTVSVAIKHISEDPAPLPQEISQQMREFIAICLRKDPQARYADGSEMASAVALVADGQRPPQPNHVPNLAITHPLTEQLGAVATGAGTAVPPVQGPRAENQHTGSGPAVPTAMGAAGAAGMAGAGAANAAARTGRQGPANRTNQSEKNRNVPLILTSLLALAAICVAAFLYFNNSDEPAPDPETKIVTSKVSATSSQRQSMVQQAPETVIITQPEEPTSEELTSETSVTEEQPTQEQPSTENQQPAETTTTQNSGVDPNQPVTETSVSEVEPSVDPIVELGTDTGA